MKTVFELAALLCLLAGCRPGGDPVVSYEGPDLSVYNAFAPASPAPDLGSLYFTIVNHRGEPDSLVGVVLEGGGRAELHTVRGGMVGLSSVPVPAAGRVDLEPGSYHIMLVDLPQPLAVGDTIAAVLEFGSRATARVLAPVVTYTEVVQNLARGVP